MITRIYVESQRESARRGFQSIEPQTQYADIKIRRRLNEGNRSRGAREGSRGYTSEGGLCKRVEERPLRVVLGPRHQTPRSRAPGSVDLGQIPSRAGVPRSLESRLTDFTLKRAICVCACECKYVSVGGFRLPKTRDRVPS